MSHPAGLVLGSRAVERPRDAGWVEAGTLAGVHPARIDWAGLVSPAGAAWSVDWWIGADDRWYLPAREPTIRQRRLGPGPVIETMVRIPSGDARHLAYTVLIGGREATVVEVHNDSPVPVALAMALRPYPVGPSRGWARAEGPRAPRSSPFPGPLRLDGPVLSAGTVPLLVATRAPAHAGADPVRDQLLAVEQGEDLHWTDRPGGPSANAVALFPLPHRTSLRFLIPSPSWPVASGPDPRQAPEAEAVARGWRSVMNAGARVELPDPGVSALFDGARARLLLASPGLASRLGRLEAGAGAELSALAVGGHRSEVAAAVAGLAESFPARLAVPPAEAADIVTAVALASSHGWLEAGMVERVAEVAAQITTLVDRSSDRVAAASARLGLARLVRRLDPAGAGRLAASVPAGLVAEANPAVTLDQVNELVIRASPAGAWGGGDGDDPVRAARFVLALRRLLIDDSGPGLVLVPGFPSSWRGGGLEVHDLPTAHGPLSFALRWHGYRPALLWQLDPDDLSADLSAPVPDAVPLTVPVLDAGWSTTTARGEALLTGSPDELPARPAPGDSFL